VRARRAGELGAKRRKPADRAVRDDTIRQNLNWLASPLRWARGFRVGGRRLMATNSARRRARCSCCVRVTFYSPMGLCGAHWRPQGLDPALAKHMPNGAIRWRPETDKQGYEDIAPLSVMNRGAPAPRARWIPCLPSTIRGLAKASARRRRGARRRLARSRDYEAQLSAAGSRDYAESDRERGAGIRGANRTSEKFQRMRSSPR